MTEWYLYLSKPEWADAWVDGGDIPVSPAAKYLGLETGGTQTPDEVMQYRVQGLDPEVYHALNNAGLGGAGIGMAFDGVKVILPNGRLTSAAGWATANPEETIILSFSRLCERRLMWALADKEGNPKESVVRIEDPGRLMEHISQVLGIPGRCEHFNYTKGVSRSHALKGWNDKHMAEIRLHWPLTPAEVRWVTLPPGMAEVVDPSSIPDIDRNAGSLDFEAYDRCFEAALAAPGVRPAATPRPAHQMMAGIRIGEGITLDLRGWGESPSPPGARVLPPSPPIPEEAPARATRANRRRMLREQKKAHKTMCP